MPSSEGGRRAVFRFLQDDSSDNSNLIGALSSLAYILRTAGEYTEAEALLWRVQGLAKQEHGGKSREVADALRRLGDLARMQGKYKRAVKFYAQAIESGGLQGSAASRAAVLAEMGGGCRRACHS
jgi:tetratricopeptide (TPR) repeat protein